MRIRSTKPEFWRSERIASVSWDARLVLKGLESFVDDNGVGKDDLALIVADVFPRDLSRNPPGTLQKVSEAISDLAQAGLVWRYEVSGTKLVYISFWESVQRIEKPTRGRFPRPDGTMNYRDSTIHEPLPEGSGRIPGGLRPGTGEQGNRGTGKNTSPPAPPTEADGAEEAQTKSRKKPPVITEDDPQWLEFWSLVPRRDGRGDAFLAWCNAVNGTGTYKNKPIKKADPADMIAGMRAYAIRVRREGTERRHIKMGQGWINGRRWEDEPATADLVPDTWGVGDTSGLRVVPENWGVGRRVIEPEVDYEAGVDIDQWVA